MAFTAIAKLLHPNETVSFSVTSAKNSVSRAWELLKMCQFVPIKLLL